MRYAIQSKANAYINPILKIQANIQVTKQTNPQSDTNRLIQPAHAHQSNIQVTKQTNPKSKTNIQVIKQTHP